MSLNQYTSNATIAVGGVYDTILFTLGDTLPDNTTELLPKLTADEFKFIKQANSFNINFKIYNTTIKKVLQWSGAGWSEVNDSSASRLVSNTDSGQTLVQIDDTLPPTAGQALVAVSSTKAVWSDVSGGSCPTPTNASYVKLIGDGTNTTIPIIHNLNTESIIVGVWEATGLKRKVASTTSILSVNSISLHFTHAPGPNALKVIIISSVFSNAQQPPPSGIDLPIQEGNEGKLLSTDGTNPYWKSESPGFINPMSSIGDIIIGSTNGLASRLALGSAGQVLTSNSGSLAWISIPTQFPDQSGNGGKFLQTDGTTVEWAIPNFLTNPMTSFGDIIIGGTSGATGRLAIGTEGQSLTVSNTGLPYWAALIPTVSGQTNKVLSNNGTITQWATFNEVPAIISADSGKILSNNGSTSLWITNTAPPSVSGQSGKFLGNNGTITTWNSISQVPSTIGNAGKILTNDSSSYFWDTLVSVLPSLVNNVGKVLTVQDTSTIVWEFPNSGFSNPMTSVGDLIVGTTGGAAIRLANGSTGQYLQTQSNGTLAWSTITAMTNPMTSQGDIIFSSGSGTPTRLGISGAGYYLSSNGTSPYWVQGSLTPPVTGHAGSWLYTDGSSAYWSTFTTIPAQTGNNGKYLTTNGSSVSWNTIPVGFQNPMTALGDLIAGNTDGVAGRIGIGSNGQMLGVLANAVTWVDPISGIPTQTGHNGQFLKTDGTTATWSNTYQVPTVVDQTGKFLGNDGTNYSWMALPNQLPATSGQSGKYLSNNGTISTWVPYSGLPDLTGQTGKILTTDGVTSYWDNLESITGSNLLSRIPIQTTTSVLSVLGDEIIAVNMTVSTFQLQSISASHACRIRLYGTTNQATTDKPRILSLDPTGNHGMYVELVLTASNLSWILSPVPTCVNMDTVKTNNIYMTVQNRSTSNTAIVINFSILKME